MPIITPEETNAIDASSNTSLETTDRLCEYDESSQEGCRRTQTMFALEEAYDTKVLPEMRWGYWDLFCVHEGKMYYDRDHISNLVSLEATQLTQDLLDGDLQSYISDVNAMSGRTEVTVSVDAIDQLVNSDTPGLPTFVDETDRFYRFEDVGEDMVTPQNMTAERLEIIKNSFNGDTNPLLMDLEGSVYIKDDVAYCTDFFAYQENPNAKFGVLIEDTENEVMKFYPFDTLTSEQEAFVTKLAQADKQMEVEIEYL